MNPAGARENPVAAMQLSTQHSTCLSRQSGLLVVRQAMQQAPGCAGHIPASAPLLQMKTCCCMPSHGRRFVVAWEPGPPREHWAVCRSSFCLPPHGLLTCPLAGAQQCSAAGRRCRDYCRACAVAGIFPSFCSRKFQKMLGPGTNRTTATILTTSCLSKLPRVGFRWTA